MQKWKRPSHPALVRDLTARMEDFRREFSDFMSEPWASESSLTPTGYLTGRFNPTVDVWETKKGYEVEIEAPGMEPKDIEVALEDNILVIQREKETKKEESDKNLLRKECSYGQFYRAIPLNHNVDPDKIEAKMKNGVLRIQLEKTAPEQEDVKRIKIKPE